MNLELSLLLLSIKGIGTKKVSTIYDILKKQGNNAEYLLDNPKDLLDFLISSGVKKGITLQDLQQAYDDKNRIKDLCNTHGIEIVGKESNSYPRSLKTLDKAPFILYYKGDIEAINRNSNVAVIGTRQPSPLASKAAYRFGAVLADYKVNVISGLALGCDTQAHKGCVDSKGITIAVLAEGLDTISPSTNKKLSQDIVESGGCLISEYPPLIRAQKGTFVQRDYLVSGISNGVIVVEASLNSGTMHTVQFAIDQYKQIGVFTSDKYIDKEATHISGNINLISSSAATPLQSKIDIDNFVKNCLMVGEFR